VRRVCVATPRPPNALPSARPAPPCSAAHRPGPLRCCTALHPGRTGGADAVAAVGQRQSCCGGATPGRDHGGGGATAAGSAPADLGCCPGICTSERERGVLCGAPRLSPARARRAYGRARKARSGGASAGGGGGVAGSGAAELRSEQPSVNLLPLGIVLYVLCIMSTFKPVRLKCRKIL
jgi:hypothetical protein